LAHPLLEIVELDVFYGDAQAIWDVSFRVDKGAIVALVGANGAGKTTMLNTISRIIEPRRGRVLWSGRPLAHLKPEEVVALGILHVPEGRRLFSRLSVMENLEMGAFLPKARPLLKESLQKIFTLFPVLKQRRHQAAGSLSGGEQQMLAIARSLMAKPSLLMLDEPSLGLAPVMVKLMFEIVQVLNREAVTILLVEQNVYQTLEIASYVYVVKTGRLELEGSGVDVLRNPGFQRAYLGALK
jgi:branched-chain amino acid transport system ATP-binding protein